MYSTGRDRSLRAWAQLLAGLLGYALAVALMIESRLGLGPWDAFHVGIHTLTGISVGMASIGVGVVIVAGSWLIGIRPGFGTLVNMVLVGVFIDLMQPLLPAATNLVWGFAYFIPAIVLCGLSTGFYIAAGLGNGPRDGLMIGLSRYMGRPVRLVRTLIELVVLVLGWLMGGEIGVGTLLFAFGIGPAVQWGLEICGVLDDAPRRIADVVRVPEPRSADEPTCA